MSDELSSSSRIPPIHMDTAKSQQAAVNRSMRAMMVAQEAREDGFRSWVDEGAFNPFIMSRRFESMESKRKRTPKEEEAEKAEKKDIEIEAVQRLDELAHYYHRQNNELQARSLLILKARIALHDTKEEILQKVLEMYPDASLADEALDFLLETSEGELAEKIRSAKEDLNNSHGREIRAGKNIQAQAKEFSEQGLGTPTGLRNLYREVTGNPRESHALFNELTAQFNYDKMKSVIDFLLHSLGGDLKAKGPSIDSGELHRLLSETRKLQSILGIFRFFKSRSKLIQSAFERSALTLPEALDFELLSKQFMKILQERYPSADKILQLSQNMHIADQVLMQIIIFTQMRDAVRQTAPKLFKTNQQRQDLLSAFIDTIDELDEKLDEMDED